MIEVPPLTTEDEAIVVEAPAFQTKAVTHISFQSARSRFGSMGLVTRVNVWTLPALPAALEGHMPEKINEHGQCNALLYIYIIVYTFFDSYSYL